MEAWLSEADRQCGYNIYGHCTIRFVEARRKAVRGATLEGGWGRG